jgi:hypothetical protein
LTGNFCAPTEPLVTILYCLTTLMKRSLAQLRRDSKESQVDSELRDELTRRSSAEHAAKKKKLNEERFTEKWRRHLAEWDQMGLLPIPNLSLPVPDPPGRCPSYLPLF